MSGAGQLLDVTQHLLDQIKLMNDHIDGSKCGPILLRVISKLGEKNSEPFNAAEQTKLCSLLQVQRSQLQDILETCGYIFEQCAYFGSSSDALNAELSRVGLASQLCTSFVQVWEEKGASFRRRLLMEHSSLCPHRLVDTQWSLQLVLAQEGLARIKQCRADLAITTIDQDAPQEQQGSVRHTQHFELTHAQLTQLSKQLDTIQLQLDALTE